MIKNKNTRQILTLITATLLGAALFYLSTGLGSVWLMAWLAPIPFLWLAYGQQPIWRVSLAAFVAFAIGNFGFLKPFAGMRAATIGIATAIIGLAIAFAISTVFARWVQKRSHWALTLLAFPALWTGIEYFAFLSSPNGTIGSMAYTQVGAPILIQSASLFGIWSITFLICLVASGIALALRNKQRTLPILATVAVVFGVNLVFGALRLQSNPATTVKVAVAAQDQPDVRFESTAAAWTDITTRYADGIAKAVKANPDVATIVLPEKIATLTPEWRDQVLAPLAQAASNNRVQIVAGFEDAATPARNIAISFNTDGSTEIYVKRKLLGAEGELTPGDKSALVQGVRAIVICKDMDFPQMIRYDVKDKDVGIMFVPAEDFFSDHWMHSRVAIMRGIEGDYSVARAARKGDIQISDNRGRILTNHASSTNFTIESAITPLGTGKTVYLAIGDLFAWASIGTVVGVIFYSLRTSKQKSSK